MIDARTPEDLLAGIAGWEDSNLTKLRGGLTNRVWLVEQGGRRAVLKLDDAVRNEPLNTRPAEARIQLRAAEEGLAANVLYHDDRALLTEYVDGTVWKPECLEHGDNIELLAGCLRRLHALPLTGRSFDSRGAARRYVAKIEQAETALVAHCVRVIETPRQPYSLCCCHNDLVAENIVTASATMFLDWEYACDNDPLFDLATIIEHHELGEDAVLRLLSAYFDGDVGRWRRKLQQQQKLYLALYWLWLAARPDSSRDELDTAAKRIGR